jgi:replicative superfamily II helicase
MINKIFSILEDDKTIQNFINQGDSKYNLIILGDPKENNTNYTKELNTKLVNIGFLYIRSGLKFLEEEKKEWRVVLEKGAKCFFYSVHVEKSKYNNYYILISSLCYYCSGQYSKAFVLMKNYNKNTQINKIISSFLRKDINCLLKEINIILLTDTKVEEENLIYSKILAEGFSYILEFIFDGDKECLTLAMERINDLIELSNLNNEPSLHLIFKLLKIIVKRYEADSLWSLVEEYPLLNKEIFYSWIKILAFNDKPISELFISQKNALKKTLDTKGAVVTLPTSSGKTKVAEITILETLLNHPESLVIYIAPFRALAHEIEKDFSNQMGILGYEITHLYGGSSYNEEDKIKTRAASIVIATPEKIKAMIRADSEISERLKLLILDEGHLIGGRDKRSFFTELLIEELKCKINRNDGKIVVLSAVLPNSKEIAKWVSQDELMIANTDWRPSSQRLGCLFFDKNNVDIQWDINIRGKDRSFNKNFLTPFRKSGARKDYPKNKKEAICYTAFKLSKSGAVMIFVPQKRSVNGYIKEIYNSFSNQIEDLELDDKITWKKFEMVCIEAYGSNSDMIKYVKKGILCHHGDLPKEVRVLLEKLMKEIKFNIIVSTSTLSQGVNIGVSYSIITSLWRNREHIGKSELWNTIGRAGRAFVDIEGKILFVHDRTDTQYKQHRNIELISSYFDQKGDEITSGILMQVKKISDYIKFQGIDVDYFLELIVSNKLKETYPDAEEIFQIIDDTLLALKYNYEVLEEEIEWEKEHFIGSWAYLESKDNFIINLMKARSEGLNKILPDKNSWKGYMVTSIPLITAMFIDEKISDIVEIITNYLNQERTLIETVIDLENIILDFPSKEFKISDIDSKYLSEIRQLWLNGVALKEICDIYSKSHKIISNYFRYKLPWALNAITRRIHHLGYIIESEELEEISQLIEYGLPSKTALNIYLSGITSRIASKEIGEITNEMEIDDYLEYNSFNKMTPNWIKNG